MSPVAITSCQQWFCVYLYTHVPLCTTGSSTALLHQPRGPTFSNIYISFDTVLSQIHGWTDHSQLRKGKILARVQSFENLHPNLQDFPAISHWDWLSQEAEPQDVMKGVCDGCSQKYLSIIVYSTWQSSSSKKPAEPELTGPKYSLFSVWWTCFAVPVMHKDLTVLRKKKKMQRYAAKKVRSKWCSALLTTLVALPVLRNRLYSRVPKEQGQRFHKHWAAEHGSAASSTAGSKP